MLLYRFCTPFVVSSSQGDLSGKFHLMSILRDGSDHRGTRYFLDSFAVSQKSHLFGVTLMQGAVESGCVHDGVGVARVLCYTFCCV